MRSTNEFRSEKYGVFFITQYNKKWIIWWDFYDEQEGDQLKPNFRFWGSLEEDCDIHDFSDMPKHGEFTTYQDAYNYVIDKFGEVS